MLRTTNRLLGSMSPQTVGLWRARCRISPPSPPDRAYLWHKVPLRSALYALVMFCSWLQINYPSHELIPRADPSPVKSASRNVAFGAPREPISTFRDRP